MPRSPNELDRSRRRRPSGRPARQRAGTPDREPFLVSGQAGAEQAAEQAERTGHTGEPAVVASFAELGVPLPLVRALELAGCPTPFPIQAATLPTSLAGRDVLGRGRTGSGKTIAFALPVVASLAASAQPSRPKHPRALVLVPTRELATQVAATIKPLARAMRLDVATVYGGVGQGPQVSALRRGVDILVACPGRLEDLIQQGHCRLGAVQVCVLDEADHLADLGFLPAVKRILDQIPAGGQRLLFSATLDRAIDALVRRYLSNPAVHSVDAVDAPPPELAHHSFTVASGHKATVVHELAAGRDRSLLFTRTKHGAKKVAKALATAGIPAVELHGNLSQAQRHRNLAAFSDGSVKVLVATDIAARGIHVDDIAIVVHVDPPAEPKAYLHRSGRTARAGAQGAVVTLALADQVRPVASLLRQAGVRATTARVEPGDARITALVGPPAELSYRAPDVRTEARRPGPPRTRAGRRPGAGAAGSRSGSRSTSGYSSQPASRRRTASKAGSGSSWGGGQSRSRAGSR